ncbi:ewing's tumor-associated antigen 1-like isoform X1 [Sinocyclocheilus rhinocerous]|uniref:Ewing's tumor-associated antigen 1-like n=1 Tax=Sinocyclocheilus rhinocerous TaxID=307959 RepID=A0A673IV85_9TELE|nr:PREDICTED: ewing's tumor-associated antigen 1-like isoform X1 [Sinocyclocheilus rhinocerous]
MEGRGSQEQHERNEIAKLTQMKSKVNRLRRSPKAATLNPGQIRNTAEFKTPTRPARGQFRRLIPDDSPSNDPDFHQDIIWDTTSPSPIRHGRGQRRAANVRAVDISDIANRIAPKNGRLEEADSSLLQWIGDSAIPCTPEVQQPKVKPMSTKQSTVEDLMRLAKQFDFNMRQDEAQEQNSDAPVSKQPEEQELPHDDRFTTAHSGSDLKPNDEKPVDERGLYQEMDDDLDFLFDGPTQRLSGRLSQASDYRTREAPERYLSIVKTSVSQKGSVLITSENHGSKQVNQADVFDDDWNSDGLLDDSLLLEMTQNPDLFAAPQYSSTQRQTHGNQNAFSAMTNQKQEAKTDVKCGTFQGQQTKSEQSFQQDSRIQAKPRIGNRMENNCTNQGFPTSKALPVPPSCFNGKQNQRKTQVGQLQAIQNSSELNAVSSTHHFQPDTKEMLPSTSLSTIKPPHSNPPSMHQNPNSGGIKQPGENAVTAKDGFSGVLDEDLDSFFASDDIWDDGVEDDDLFCEACDNLEEFSGNAETPATNNQQNTAKALQNKPYGTSETACQQTVFAHPYPPKKSADNVSTSSANTSVSLYGQKAHAGNSGPAGLGSNVSCDATRPSGPSSNGPYKFKQVRSSSVVGRGTCAVPPTQQGHERGVLAVLQSDVRTADSHQFRKPCSDSFRSAPVIAKDVCNSGAVRCSDAEIERKKQQAVERRRLRMLANQNLRAPV